MDNEATVLILTSSLVSGILVSVVGGVVAAAHTYSNERKNIPPTFDWVDFILLVVTGSFSGFIGYLFAEWKLDETNLILAIAGLSAIGGYKMLLTVKDVIIEVLKSWLENGKNKNDNIKKD